MTILLYYRDGRIKTVTDFDDRCLVEIRQYVGEDEHQVSVGGSYGSELFGARRSDIAKVEIILGDS